MKCVLPRRRPINSKADQAFRYLMCAPTTTRVTPMGKTGVSAKSPAWWVAPWDAPLDPDADWVAPKKSAWFSAKAGAAITDDAILAPLEEQFGQVRSRERVRDLAEVFTHQREVDAMLDQMTDAFEALDVKFLEPACGSGNFLTEILRRKLRLVTKDSCVCQEQYEHRLLRALASIYGIDISEENVTEARGRLAHVVLEHVQSDAAGIQPSDGFLHAAALIIGDNIVLGDTLAAADTIELCDWQPRPGGCFQRVWSPALVPEDERDLFWAEREVDAVPVHYSALKQPIVSGKKPGAK